MNLLRRIRSANLKFFEFPGGGYALETLGLDAAAQDVGLEQVANPRHADLLLVLGPVPEELREPLSRVHAEIPRPHYTIALGSGELPVPVDETAGLDDAGLEEAVATLRRRVADGYEGAPPASVEEQDEDELGMGPSGESEDGLMLEWLPTQLGPVHPATPGGLGLTVTLDGDLVAETELVGGYTDREIVRETTRRGPGAAAEALRWLDPRAPVSGALLYVRALEDACGTEVPEGARYARIYLQELERVSSHLLWLSGSARILGVEAAADRALAARRPLLPALWNVRVVPGGLVAQSGGLPDVDLGAVRDGLQKARNFLERRGSLLPYRLEGLAAVDKNSCATGPVARASGVREDTRLQNKDYKALGFEPVLGEWDDALARYEVRLREIEESLRLAEIALPRASSGTIELRAASGSGSAVLETPRGRAEAALSVRDGRVEEFHLSLPSAANAKLLAGLIYGVSISDAVTTVWSLDLSPEEMDTSVERMNADAGGSGG